MQRVEPRQGNKADHPPDRTSPREGTDSRGDQRVAARARHRGHPIHWTGSRWAYTDWSDTTLTQYGRERPCVHCGQQSDGPDHCLGELPHVRAACCGHGRPEDAYFIFHNGVEVRGEEAVVLQQCWQHTNVTPRLALSVYLRVLNAEVTYRLCRLCTTGCIKSFELIQVAEIITRKSFDIDTFCDILEVYGNQQGDKYELEIYCEHPTPDRHPQ